MTRRRGIHALLRPSLLRSAFAAFAAFAAFVAFAGAGDAQQINGSAAAFGLSGAFTARASGSSAAAWNPANLGLSGGPAFSLQLLAPAFSAGLDPVDLSDLAAWNGKPIPAATREDWLRQIASKGSQALGFDGGTSWFGLGFGPFAVQVSSRTYATGELNPDAAEAFLFGNAGRTGTPRDLHPAGSNLRGGAFTTVAASYGVAVGEYLGLGPGVSFGLTGKYVIGHGLGIARDNGTSITADNLQVRFPIAQLDPNQGLFSAGSGIGLDAGIAWRSPVGDVGATISNVFNTFSWDPSKLQFRAGEAHFDGVNSEAAFRTAPFSGAPQFLKDAVANNRFSPTIGLGFAREMPRSTIVSADIRRQLGDGDAIVMGAQTHIGIGAEVRMFPTFPLRGGLSYADGLGVSGGFGLQVLGVELGVAGMVRSRSEGREQGAMFSIQTVR